MSNMSYCRFRNTLQDLLDCESALNDADLDNPFSGLSDDEARAAKRLIKACERITLGYGEGSE